MKVLRHVAAFLFAALLGAWCGATTMDAGGASAWNSAPRIDGFDVEQVSELGAGSELLFTVFGTPGGQAVVQIDGAAHELALAEHESGVYEGRYMVGSRDRMAPDSRVVAELSAHGEVARSVLEEPLVLGTPRSPAMAEEAPPVRRVSEPAPPRRCGDCGVIEAIQHTRVQPQPGLLGLIAGGLLGALLGDQVAHGDQRRAARVLGAVGGAYAGHEIERHARMRDRFDVVVRLDDGQRRTVAFDQPPPWRVGDAVRLADGRVQRLPPP